MNKLLNQKKLSGLGPIGIFAASMIILFIITPSFRSMANFTQILLSASVYMLLAMGMSFAIIIDGIDLSAGSIVGLTGGIACMAMTYLNLPVPVALILGVLVGAVCGLINGLLVAKAGLPAFIATMGMLSVGDGISLLLSNGTPIKYGTSWISLFGGSYVGPVPVQVIVMIVMIVLAWLFAQYTVTGRNIYAVGNNPRAAKLTGINTDGIIIMCYIICGCMCSLVGLMMMGQLKQAGPSYGSGYELDAIAASVIGGISMAGGEGNIYGVALGAILMALLRNLFVQIAVPGYWQTVVLGVVIIASVAIDCVRKKREAR